MTWALPVFGLVMRIIVLNTHSRFASVVLDSVLESM